MITGPNGPFCNIPPAIETHVEFISTAIAKAEKSTSKAPVIEATSEAEDEWTDLCDKISQASLFRKTDSWIFGANIAGKKNAVLFYFGGLGAYRKVLREVAGSGYKGYKPFLDGVEATTGVQKQAVEHIEFAMSKAAL